MCNTTISDIGSDDWDFVSDTESTGEYSSELESEYLFIQGPKTVEVVPTYAQLVSSHPKFETATGLAPKLQRRQRKRRKDRTASAPFIAVQDAKYVDLPDRKIRRNKYDRSRPKNAKCSSKH